MVKSEFHINSGLFFFFTISIPVKIWDIFKLKHYWLFIRNLDLTGHLVFPLAALPLSLFRDTSQKTKAVKFGYPVHKLTKVEDREHAQLSSPSLESLM